MKMKLPLIVSFLLLSSLIHLSFSEVDKPIGAEKSPALPLEGNEHENPVEGKLEEKQLTPKEEAALLKPSYTEPESFEYKIRVLGEKSDFIRLSGVFRGLLSYVLIKGLGDALNIHQDALNASEYHLTALDANKKEMRYIFDSLRGTIVGMDDANGKKTRHRYSLKKKWRELLDEVPTDDKSKVSIFHEPNGPTASDEKSHEILSKNNFGNVRKLVDSWRVQIKRKHATNDQQAEKPQITEKLHQNQQHLTQEQKIHPANATEKKPAKGILDRIPGMALLKGAKDKLIDGVHSVVAGADLWKSTGISEVYKAAHGHQNANGDEDDEHHGQKKTEEEGLQKEHPTAGHAIPAPITAD